jgi:superfamily II DNA helicase RecQ
MPGAVFVLPTAGGKSLAYIVPCLCDLVPSMTIAIIPFVAVKDEAFVKAHCAGIHAVDYQPEFQGTVPLLIFSAEHAVTDGFMSFIRVKAREGVV